MCKKVLLLLAEGFEEIEALGTCDILRRAGFHVELISTMATRDVAGAHNITVRADRLIGAEDDGGGFDALVLPGGMPGSVNLREDPRVIALVQAMHEAGKIVAAICAAPIVLDRAGILHGRRFTGYPGLDELYGGHAPGNSVVETDGNIVTGRGPGATFAFAEAVAEALGEGPRAEVVLQGMLVKN